MWMRQVKNTISEALAQPSQCCFCGEPIKDETPVLITLDLGDNQTQSMGTHGLCLQERLHPSIPFVAPDEVGSD